MQTIDTLLEEYQLLHKKEEILKDAASSIGIKKEKVSDEDLPIGSSKFGGLPDLPSHLSFPKHHDHYLSFLAQFNLDEASQFDKNKLLPSTGILYFFYDVVEQPWGLFPNGEDQGSFKVFYFDGDIKELKRTPYPEVTDEYFPLPSFKCTYKKILSFPEDRLMKELKDDEWSNFFDFREKYVTKIAYTENNEEPKAHPKHYMLGEPFTIQGNVYADIVHYYSNQQIEWKSEEMKMKIKEMVLLFQMDSDEEDLGVMWGDVGIIYFCIDKLDLIERRFDQTKFMLQCY